MTDGSMCELPKYQCIKKVWALKIKEIFHEGDAVFFKATDDRFTPIQLSMDYVNKHKPEAGGYYVVYEGGYKSFSPAESFEEGYITEQSEWALVDSVEGRLVNLPDSERPVLFQYGDCVYLGVFNHDEHEFGFYTNAIIGGGDFVEAEHITKWKYLT